MALKLPGERHDIVPLDQINAQIGQIQKRIKTSRERNPGLFPKTRRPEEDAHTGAFPDLPADPKDLDNDAIEYYIFVYQGWIEYYEEIELKAESNVAVLKAKHLAVKMAIYDSYKSDKEKEFTASELQRVKITEAAPETLDVAGDIIEAEHDLKMVRLQLHKLKDRSKKLSRIIELRTGGRRRDD